MNRREMIAASAGLLGGGALAKAGQRQRRPDAPELEVPASTYGDVMHPVYMVNRWHKFKDQRYEPALFIRESDLMVRVVYLDGEEEVYDIDEIRTHAFLRDFGAPKMAFPSKEMFWEVLGAFTTHNKSSWWPWTRPEDTVNL